MSQRFGVVRGLSSEDACARYALLYLGSPPDGWVWRPVPLDQDACLEAVRRDEGTGDWILRYSQRPRELPGEVGPQEVREAGVLLGRS